MMDRRTTFTRVAAAGWLAFTLYQTLRPVGWLQHEAFWSFFTSIMAGVDAVQNLVLFAPMGWVARRAGWPLVRCAAAALLLSGSIEFAQQWVPGRTSTAMDIASNTMGAALGWWAAARATRPRVRMGLALALLAGFMSLHVLNTAWPDLAERVDGAGLWNAPERVICPLPARASTVCVRVPNSAANGQRYLRVVGSPDQTYARLQADDAGHRLGRDDCALLSFESTIGAQLHLRPPMETACGVADTADREIVLRIDPRLEHERAGAWTPTRAGTWMWPVWPFTEYRPGLLRALGAVTFVALAALLAGVAPWMLPAGYLLMLEAVALLADMRGPGWWDVGWAAIAWLAAAALVRVDAWWQPATAERVSSGRA